MSRKQFNRISVCFQKDEWILCIQETCGWMPITNDPIDKNKTVRCVPTPQKREIEIFMNTQSSSNSYYPLALIKS